jgi:PEP-CTERM motif
MKINPLICIPLMLLMPLLSEADTIQIVQGTPGDNTFLPPISPSPSFTNVINFANLESQITSLPTAAQENCINNGLQCPSFTSTQYASQGVTISSPDGLLIYPFSDQTAGGIELFDPGATNPSTCLSTSSCDGTANITISLTNGVGELAVGLSDFDDPVSVTLTVLGAGDTILESMNVSSAVEAATQTTGQTYFVAEDTAPGIYGLQITQTIATDGAGLALAEVEYTPEPSTLLLLIGGGLAIIGSARLRKKA